MKKQKSEIDKKIQDILANTYFILALCVLITALSYCAFNYLFAFGKTAIDVLTLSIKNQTVLPMELPSLKCCFLFIPNLKVIYIIIGVLLLVVNIKLFYKMKTSFTKLDQGQKGDREFSTMDELKKQYKCIPEKDKTYSGGGGVLISRYKKKIFIDDSPVNNLIIGTTRSGKGETYVIPSIDIYSRAKEKPSIVANDPKGELAGACTLPLTQRGYDTLVLDLVNFLGLSYNPLEIIKEAYQKGNHAEAQLLARTFSFILFNDPNAKDKTWQNWSISLTNALIMAHIIDCMEAGEEEKINMYSVTNLLINLGQRQIDEKTNQLDLFFSERPLDDIARIQYSSVAFAQGKLKGNIYANTLAKLEIFTYENVAKMTSKNNVDLISIGYGEKPQVVFMVTPDYDCSNHFLATVFISQLYYVSAKRASKTKGNKCTREVIFMLDEFGNMSAIPDMSNIITVCLGRNIRFNMIVQAYSQIESKYGRDDSKTIIGNCGNQIYLLTNELNTAEHFSKLIGNKTITVKNQSGESLLDMDKKISEHIESMALLNPNDLMEFVPVESAVVRVMKRQDLKRNKVTPKPIFNTEDTILKFRYEYLPEFDTSNSLESLNLINTCEHKDVDIKTILYMPCLDVLDEDYEFQVETGSPSEEEQQTLGLLIKAEALENLSQIIGIEADYSNMSIDNLESFLQEALVNEFIDESTLNRAMAYIQKLIQIRQEV
jgi:type IV secretion system protein VirD4